MKRPCVLTSKSTGEQHIFETTKEASEFLHREISAMRRAAANGLTVSHFFTGERFDIIILGKPKKQQERQQKPKQLCFTCQKAVCGCSWSRNFIPVDGWTATPTKIKQGGNTVKKTICESYLITACPEYVED